MRGPILFLVWISLVLSGYPVGWFFIIPQMPAVMSQDEAEIAAIIVTTIIYLPLFPIVTLIVMSMTKPSRTVWHGKTSDAGGPEDRKKKSRVGEATDLALTLALLDDDSKKR